VIIFSGYRLGCDMSVEGGNEIPSSIFDSLATEGEDLTLFVDF
jgi:hypothetical protein